MNANFWMVTSIALFASCSVSALPAENEWQASFYSGSNRLLLFSILKENPNGSFDFAQELLRRNGLDRDAGQGARQLSFGSRVSPILEWDGNINGGTPDDTFFLGRFEFSVDEESRAKSGVLVGLSSEITSRYSIAYGQTLDLGLRATYAYSPEHEITKASGQASACGTFYLENWTWFETCGRVQYAENALSSVTDRVASVGGIKVFSSAFGSHEARAGVDVQFRDDYAKTIGRFDLTTVGGGLGALRIALTIGERIENSNTLLYGGSASLNRPILGEPGSISLSYSRLGGSTFFGEDRDDDLISMRITRQLTDSFSGTIGFTQRDSTVLLFEEEAVFVGFNFRGLRF